jgi:hypothetical protein
VRPVTTLVTAEQPWFPAPEGRVAEEAQMAATSTLVRYEDPLDVHERGAVAGFLAGYSGNTRVSYTTDLRLVHR